MIKIHNHSNEGEIMSNMRKNRLQKTHHQTTLNRKFLIVESNVIKTVKAII